MITETKVADWIKVGVKGKTRGGDDYEVIALEPRIDRPVLVYTRGDVQARGPDGRVNIHVEGTNRLDLLPPTRTVYVNFHSDCCAYFYLSEKEARNGASDAFAIAVPVEIPHV